jgi:hypothetical protein
MLKDVRVETRRTVDARVEERKRCGELAVITCK